MRRGGHGHSLASHRPNRGGKHVPDDIRFQILYKLLPRSFSNIPMVRPGDTSFGNRYSEEGHHRSESTAEIGRIPSSIGTASPLVSLPAIP
jgi:hypothetical protein